MKTIAKLTLMVAALGTFAGVALAGDPTPRWQAEMQRQKLAELNRPAATIAVYNKGGLGNCAAQNQPRETHFEFRTNAHGQTFGVYLPGRK